MFAKLLKPQTDWAGLILRLGLAAIFGVHGYFKLRQDIPMIPDTSLELQIAVGWGEMLCGLALMIGLLSRVAAIGIIVIQVGAIVRLTGQHALSGLDIENKGADYFRVGPEYNVVLICMALAVVLIGSGKISVDSFLSSLCCGKNSETKAPV